MGCPLSEPAPDTDGLVKQISTLGQQAADRVFVSVGASGFHPDKMQKSEAGRHETVGAFALPKAA